MGASNTTDTTDTTDTANLFADLADRPLAPLAAVEELTPEQLNAHPGGHPNSIAWLLWHSGRQADAQLSDLTGAEQVWTSQGYRERFGLGELGDGIGLGHTPEEAAQIVVDDAGLLREYLAAVLGELRGYATSLGGTELSAIIDDSYTPPVSRGTRLVSIIDDCQQHVGAALHVTGAVTGRSVGLA